MFDKIFSIILGIGLIVLGPIIIFGSNRLNVETWKVTLNFTGYNVLLGLFMIVVGIAFIWTTAQK